MPSNCWSAAKILQLQRHFLEATQTQNVRHQFVSIQRPARGVVDGLFLICCVGEGGHCIENEAYKGDRVGSFGTALIL